MIILLVLIAVIFVIQFYNRNFKHDTTILFTGGLGSGKSLNSVKLARKLYNKNLFKWRVKKVLRVKILKKDFNEEKPLFYSNIPILLKAKINIKESVKNKRIKIEKTYSNMFNFNHIIFKERLNQKSVVLLDELPLLVNQYSFNLPEVKGNINEFITLFRHYVGGYLIINAQNETEIVKQIRSKLNSFYFCYDFKKYFNMFYSVKIKRRLVGDTTISTDNDLESEARSFHVGMLTKSYDNRCYRVRYFYVKDFNNNNFKSLQQIEVITFNKDKSYLQLLIDEQKNL